MPKLTLLLCCRMHLACVLYLCLLVRIKHWRKHGGLPPEGVGQAVGQAAAIIRKATERRRGGFAGAGGRFGGASTSTGTNQGQGGGRGPPGLSHGGPGGGMPGYGRGGGVPSRGGFSGGPGNFNSGGRTPGYGPPPSSGHYGPR